MTQGVADELRNTAIGPLLRCVGRFGRLCHANTCLQTHLISVFNADVRDEVSIQRHSGCSSTAAEIAGPSL